MYTPAVALAPDYPEDDRNERRKQNHQQKVFQDFLPAPISKASRARIKFRRPATIIKTLPYSEVASSGCSLTANPRTIDPIYRSPEPKSQNPKRVERSPSLVS